ncbi:lectin subunit alpha-like [Calliphora vicina]|uniref:lectin subunit alpha-like n=1 Tax=Calliphora vicina TaxID=7373 RepID=UPI00325BF521
MSLTYSLYLILIILFIFKVHIIATVGRMYTSDRNNTYYIEDEKKYNWMEAFANCVEMNMSLLTIDSVTKSNEINQLVQKTFGKNIPLWVGGIMTRHPTRHFIWLPMGKPFIYTYWEGNNPDFANYNEYCVEIGWGNKMEWNDKYCNHQIGFVCEPNPQLLKIENLQRQLQQAVEKVQESEKHKLESVNKDFPQKEMYCKENLEKNQEILQQLEDIKNKTHRDLILHFHQDRYMHNAQP